MRPTNTDQLGSDQTDSDSKYRTDNFELDVIEQSYNTPVLVDFWAEWCGPCQVLGPTLEKLAEEQKDRWTLVKVDTEKHQQIAQQYQIQSIPNVKLFVDGQVIDEFSGALQESMVVQWLDKALPSKFRDQLKQAVQLLSEKKGIEAQSLLKSIIDEEPSNDQARILLAQTLLYIDPAGAAEVVRPIEPGSDFYELAEATHAFSDLFQHLDNPQELPDSEIKDTYLEAINNLRENKFEEALEGFIEVVRVDRSYDDEGARKACIAIFKSQGESHEITRTYRPKFSRVLHS